MFGSFGLSEDGAIFVAAVALRTARATLDATSARGFAASEHGSGSRATIDEY